METAPTLGSTTGEGRKDIDLIAVSDHCPSTNNPAATHGNISAGAVAALSGSALYNVTERQGGRQVYTHPADLGEFEGQGYHIRAWAVSSSVMSIFSPVSGCASS
jgi:hypothetical protein